MLAPRIVLYGLLLGVLPAQVEVLDSGGHPSEMIERQIRKGEDEFVLYDTAFPIRESIVRMLTAWYDTESARHEGLVALLAAMAERLGEAGDEPAAGVARAVEVARALLAETPELPPGAAHDELLEVLGGGRGRLRFGVMQPDWDCSSTTPKGSYAATAPGRRARLAGLFRATVYLRTYLERWPGAQSDLYSATARACLDASGASRLPECDRELRRLFGGGVLAPGIPLGDVAPDVAFLVAAGKGPDAPQRPWQVLGAMFDAVNVPERRSVRDHALDLVHALAEQRADHELFQPLGTSAWRAKWFDAAAFAYVGVREVDCLWVEACDRSPRQAPRIVIEPVPEVWAAIARLNGRLFDKDGDPHRTPSSAPAADPILEALAVQQRGEDLAPDLEATLLRDLCWIFSLPDHSLGTASTIEGLGRFRRAPVQLVRIPIQWRGAKRKALALRLYVEHESAPGDWQAPPWGEKLDPAAAAKWFPAR